MLAHACVFLMFGAPPETMPAAEARAPEVARDEPRAVNARPARPWSLGAEVGFQALGFKPVPPNPTFSVGAEVRGVKRKVYSLHLGMWVGGFWQLGFLEGAHLDVVLGNRWTAPFGLYGELDIDVGAQLGVVPSPTYALTDGRVGRRRPPTHAAARLGLGVKLGFDTSRWTKTPMCFFVHYRQMASTPFMLGNGLPAMGTALLTVGTSIRLGRESR